ncbi:MAG: DoxX family membrane protein [Chitinophagaceae bacterium]|nr:MAG: DoxX family membrane protein [Chitinophagaceae bacterium]
MKKIILFIVSLLFGLMFINAGLNKFFNYMPPPKEMPEKMLSLFTAFMSIPWLMPLVGAVEILGGLLFIFPKTRALGAIVILPILVGILFTHALHAPEGLPIAVALLLIEIWVLVENRHKYLPMLTK